MSRAAAQENDQEGALRFAELAVEKNPSDPSAQASLGDLYLAQGLNPRAEASYRKALALDDRQHAVYLKLAELLAKSDRSDEALEALFHVVRTSRSPEAIGISTRRAISLSVPLAQVWRVEDVLRPLAIGHPEQPIYRTLLLEVLGSQMYPLLLKVSHAQESESREAREALADLSNRSTGPLLSALSGTHLGEQQTAIALLAHGTTSGAASGLLAFAETSSNEEQRLLAVLALGRLTSRDTVKRLGEMVASGPVATRGRVARAAAWALSRHHEPAGAPYLLQGLSSGDPELRAFCALGLGDLDPIRDSDRDQALVLLLEQLKTPASGVTARAAAALALGSLARKRGVLDWTRRDVSQALLTAIDDRSPLVKRTALLSLAQMPSKITAREHVAAALFSESEVVRRSATKAAVALMTESATPTSLLPQNLSPGELSAEQRIAQALTAAEVLPHTQRHAALVALETPLIEHAKIGLLASQAAARTTIAEIGASELGALLGELLTRSDYTAAPAATSLKDAQEAAERIRLSLKDELLALAAGPHHDLARQALRRPSPDDGPAARRIIARKLRDPSPETHQAALTALTGGLGTHAISLLRPYLRDEEAWGRRRRAAHTLGDILRSTSETGAQEQAKELLLWLTKDRSDLVSQEAARQLKLH
jgi:tetratricopeptide (TPR) repeat protein